MNNDLISREALREDFYELEIHGTMAVKAVLPIIEKRIDNLPAVDAVEVKHGRWILGIVEPGYCTPGGNRPWVCSECGEIKSWRLDKPTENYCPNCGARMDGE